MIGLVGLGHGLSHLLQLALPPLFPLLRVDFGASWTLLGSLVGVFYAMSGVIQFTAGFWVDRFGARPVLLGGAALLVLGTLLAAATPSVYWLFPIVALMGAGNGVFHPADFAILNKNVAKRRLGYAYSAHGVFGNLGYAIAPIASFSLATLFGWRGALAIIGAFGICMLVLLYTQRAYFASHRSPDHHSLSIGSTLAMIRQVAIVACFGYFMLQTAAGVGLQAFAGNALNAAFDVPLALANSAVTAYLLGASAGIIAGGFIAARTRRHDRVAAVGLLTASVLSALVAFGPSIGVLLPLFAIIGFSMGATGPSRDLIVFHVTPPGAAGRVYGFVYSGLDVGATLGPLWFGWMLDHGQAPHVFVAIAVLFALAIMTVLQTRRPAAAQAT